MDFKTATELMELIDKYDGTVIEIEKDGDEFLARVWGVSLENDIAVLVIGRSRENGTYQMEYLDPSTARISPAEVSFDQVSHLFLDENSEYELAAKALVCSNCSLYMATLCWKDMTGGKHTLGNNTCDDWSAK